MDRAAEILERRQPLWRRNPLFEHLDWQGWIAWRGSQPVGRIPLIGVRKRHQYSRLGLALARELIAVRQDRSIAKGFQGVKLSWILEDNAGMRYILENLGAELYKRYRLYQKSLAKN